MKNVLIALGITALTVILLEALTPLAFIVSLFSGILFGIGTAVVLLARSRGENPETMAKEVVEAAKAVVTESKSSVEERAANEQLARTYETLLLSGKAPTVVPAVQELIMTLRSVVSRALQFAEASETTFNVVKLAKEDLPEAVRLFLDLSDTDRAAKQGEFIAQLSTLSKKIVELVSIIDAGQADAFDAQSGFINLKFN
ncbi:hypothetical protein [Acinetobacter sp.]|uniref:hypothetical protein n=1 Tax=Acinetobacter sp. TaxID=472 RepID=UPI0037525015